MAESRFSETIAQLEAELPGIEARRRRLEDELTAAVARENAVRGAIQSLQALAGLPASQDITPVGSIRAEADAIVGDRPEQLAAEVGAALDRGRESAEKATTGTDTATKTAKKSTAKKAAPAKKATAKKAAPAKKTAAKKTAAKKTTDGERPRTRAKKTAAATGTGPVRTGAEPDTGKSEKAAPAPRRRTTGATSDSVLGVLADAQGPVRAREVTARLGIEESADNVNAVRTMLERLAKAGRAQRPGRGLYAKLDR
ncbi:type IV toxin-antitoxin system AbiEi family antitoxin domain-containing protein [Kitasatospora aureofaciens]|uniref:type IV toxin-antitoxin system AbiEi family antitoxin domain-containing protein n=1 Tax=Kitasatospora aureofaciens TaxID=1894 RepID=UPI000527DC60|nr:type IV toxin-antitoxin system AbiEi family antitoxin domain-containing protein [Kitasatospora aureofaciens]